MGLVYQTTKWVDGLWNRHYKASRSCRQVLQEGTKKQPEFAAFSNDIHAVLYSRHEPDRKDTAPEWATGILDQAHDLAEWKTLRARCERNGFATGIAAESILEALIPLLPEEPEPQPRQTPQEGAGSTQAQGQGQGPSPHHNGEGASAVRRALRQAMRAAQDAVDEAEASTEAMAEAMGLHAGTGPGQAETWQDLEQVRQLWALLRDNPTMRHIAEMAGRLQRLGQAHKKCQVTPAVGWIKGVALGGDLERILPAELAGLRSKNRIQRLATLGKIMGKRALQYEYVGTESLTKGPMIILLDESGSMRAGGKQEWSKAVAMSLMSIATQQRRACYLAGFDTGIRHAHRFLPAETTLEGICNALMVGCGGGTDFSQPIQYAMQVLQTEPVMAKADIVIVTDGEATIDHEVITEITHAKDKADVHLYGVLIGRAASGKSLQPVATALYQVGETPQQDSQKIAPLLAQV